MVLEGALPVGRQRVDQRPALGHREGRRHPDVMEGAGAVVEAEEQGADHPAALVPPEAGHDAVGGPLVLDLQHDPLALPVGELLGLGHHAVEPGALEGVEPLGGQGPVGGAGRDMDRRTGVAQHRLQPSPTLNLR